MIKVYADVLTDGEMVGKQVAEYTPEEFEIVKGWHKDCLIRDDR